MNEDEKTRRLFLHLSTGAIAGTSVFSSSVSAKKDLKGMMGRNELINRIKDEADQNGGLSDLTSEKVSDKKYQIKYVFDNGNVLPMTWKPIGNYRAKAKIGSKSYKYHLPEGLVTEFENQKRMMDVEIKESVEKSHNELAERLTGGR